MWRATHVIAHPTGLGNLSLAVQGDGALRSLRRPARRRRRERVKAEGRVKAPLKTRVGLGPPVSSTVTFGTTMVAGGIRIAEPRIAEVGTGVPIQKCRFEGLLSLDSGVQPARVVCKHVPAPSHILHVFALSAALFVVRAPATDDARMHLAACLAPFWETRYSPNML